jgi:2-(1,2-epoxy-1,2-dihydrophenyl)acetyl-CoA isomerase
MAFEKLLSETTSDGVLVLTMNDPATLNALGAPLMPELLSEVERFDRDPELRAHVVTGAGRAFSSGANLRGFAREIDQREADPVGAPERAPSAWERLDATYWARETGSRGDAPEPVIMRRLQNLQKPSFAAVNGYAYGAGCGIALSCDFRVAAESARFAEAFIRYGVAPPDGSTWQLPKLIGMSHALWMQYSGEPVGGAEAVRLGLANWLVPDDRLMDRTLELATKLARGAVYAMGAVKQLVYRGYQQELSEHMRLASRAFGLLRDTPEYREGVRAFIEKRQPDFRGGA